MGPRGILVQYRNTSAASGSKKASYVEKGKLKEGKNMKDKSLIPRIVRTNLQLLKIVRARIQLSL